MSNKAENEAPVPMIAGSKMSFVVSERVGGGDPLFSLLVGYIDEAGDEKELVFSYPIDVAEDVLDRFQRLFYAVKQGVLEGKTAEQIAKSLKSH